MADEEGSGPLFSDVVFTIIPSNDFHEDDRRDCCELLEANGGRHVPLRADRELDELDNLTHIIAANIDFPQYRDTVDRGISTVKRSWVSHSLRRKKQASARQHSPDPSQYFGDVVVTCADIPDGDAEAIIAGVIALGGQHSYPLTKLVTHVVTSSLKHDKCRIVEEKGHKCKVVLPHWFNDCFLLGKRLSERPYEFPDPELLRRDNKPNVKPHPSSDIAGAVSPSPREFPVMLPSPSKSRKNLNILQGKYIYFSNDLELGDGLKESLKKMINHARGVVVDDPGKANVYIGYYRDGDDYVAASRAKKEVGNLTWLYHILNQNSYSSPLKRSFHYPLPRNGVPGFEHMKISLSNYAGDSRNYVENLIRACGAEYTKTMKQDNTHLITAHKHGEKCDAAQEWNIKLVNHLWLEESFAKCSIQSCTNDKYTTFPTRTNLGEITGRTGLDLASIEKKFFPKPKSPQKRPAERSTPRKTVSGCSAVVDDPIPQHDADCDVPIMIAEADEMEFEPAAPQTAKKARGRPPRSAAATPRVPFGQENATPSITSTGRASKAKALNSIHDSAGDIALYEREMKRKGGVTHGRERRSSVADMSSPAPAARKSKKRPSEEYEVTAQGSDLSDGETQNPPAKQAKKTKHATSSSLPPVQYRMMVTGIDRWTDAKKEAAEKTALRGLGVLLVQDPQNVDILVAPKILRTKKFVSALACAPLVVDTSFLDYAISKKKLQENPPMLKDKDTEERLGINLADSLERAKQNKKRLFANWAICVTKEVNGGFDTYKDIISLNGGEPMMYQGRQKLQLSKPENQAGNEFDYVYLVSGKTEPEIKLWKKFRENASSQGLEAKIVSSDWILNAAMSQKITLSDEWVLDEESQRNG